LPLAAPPLIRSTGSIRRTAERFYGFDAGEIVESMPACCPLDLDPKLAGALRTSPLVPTPPR